MRANYIDPDKLNLLLAKMMPQNALALRVSLATGLRIDDVLKLKTQRVARSNRITVREMKTDKAKRCYIPLALHRELVQASGAVYVFKARMSEEKHRTRQAVFLDLKRACRSLGIDTAHVSPHSVRKNYAVSLYERTGSLEEVQAKLNHENIEVTVLYAFADKLQERYKPRKLQKAGK